MLNYSSHDRRSFLNIWPGFVDALTALIMVLLFVVLVFVLSQHYLSTELTGSNKAVDALSTEMQRLTDLLSRAHADKKMLSKKIAALETSLNTTQEALAETEQQKTLKEHKLLSLQEQMIHLQQQLEEMRSLLRESSTSLEQSQGKNKVLEEQVTSLSEKLEEALNSKLHKLAQYQSEFFGRLKEALAERTDIKVVGDRFMFQSEVLFDSASADLGENGKTQLDALAASLQEIAATLPDDLNWILRVDGHTDKRPIHNEKFRSNWELSAARAISVVNYLISKGIPAKRLAAAGFGEFQPLASGKDADKNRRIELKLDQR